MYAGCWNFETLKVSVAILNSIREETGSQWSLWSNGDEDYQIAWLTDKLLEHGNFELPGGDLWIDFGSPSKSESTIIRFWYNQWICKDYSRGNIQWWLNLTKLSNLVICRFAYWRDVFSQRQATIKSNTKVSYRCWGWDYVTTKDYWGQSF